MPFNVGDVISIYTDRSHNTKNKYCIIVAESKTNDDWLVVFICSEQPAPEVMKEYYPDLKKNESTPYLSYDSFTNCWDPVEMTPGEILAALEKPSNMLGTVSDDYIDLIKALVRKCPQITNGLKKQYFGKYWNI